ncbi:MAG: hypothetical protein EON87_12355 [Brevundimonas sp.]|nr:MAG: hypothetical protein EON87_12355 [Brevundimonas sp.]
MRLKLFAATLALVLLGGTAEAMSVDAFLTTAGAVPQNPTALLRADTRRLIGEFRGAMRTVRQEQVAAKAAGRSTTCIPDEVRLSPNDILGRFNAIPAGRRSISVTQAVREWMTERYPCA